MKVTFVGSGNVATHLALALHGAGHEVVQVCSRHYDHAARLARRVKAVPATDVSQLSAAVDVIILAVGDDVLPIVASQLHPGKALVLHTSGAVEMQVLRPTCRRCGVLWSPQTFVREVIMDYGALPFCVEGSSEEATVAVEQLARTVSPYVCRLNGAQRRYVHLSTVLTNNFVNALNALAQDMLREQGVPFGILHPIIYATAQRAEVASDLEGEWHDGCGTGVACSLWQLQTGPAARGDERTIQLHRSLLQEEPDALRLYDAMTLVIKHHVEKR